MIPLFDGGPLNPLKEPRESQDPILETTAQHRIYQLVGTGIELRLLIDFSCFKASLFFFVSFVIGLNVFYPDLPQQYILYTQCSYVKLNLDSYLR